LSDTGEKNGSNNGTIHQLFTDFEKAYDSVRRKVLYNILPVFGTPTKLVTGKNLLDASPIQNGLKQGDATLQLFLNFSL
jgi:hypothetical protein